MENAQLLFDKIDIITASHLHRDHFDANMVMKHLHNNQLGIFISTPQSIDELKKEHKNFEVIKEQVFEINIELGDNINITKNGIDMKILDLNIVHILLQVKEVM